MDAMPSDPPPAFLIVMVSAVVPEAVEVGNPQLENQISRLHNEKAALERRVTALESQLRMAADSRWLKLGRRLGYGPKLR